MNMRNHLRAEVINPFLTATTNVLEMMAEESPKPGRPSLKKPGTGTGGDVTGIILMDAVGEITNQIAGSGRAQLDEIGYNFEMVIPSIIRGSGHQIFGIDTAPCVLIPFTSQYGSFTVEFSLKAV